VRNLLFAFDGTWQVPDTDPADGDKSTNVWRLVNSLKPQSSGGTEQLSWYFSGLGTQLFNQLRGGLFGQGLSSKIVEGYSSLARHYRPGDRIFFAGFSRGAYTARSLAGMIARVGLVRDEEEINQAYTLYRQGSVPEQRRFRKHCARQIPIEAIAVWDTVGALGIPLGWFDDLNQHFLQFHDTQLGSNVRHAYQALAIDEHRRSFAPTLWTPSTTPQQTIEQRWFVGAHSDVGGGYNNALLSTRSLAWIQSKLGELGLTTHRVEALSATALQPTDSWQQFLAGLYSLGSERYYRPIGYTRFGAEVLAGAVPDHLSATDYRPLNPIGRHLRGYHPSVQLLSDYRHLGVQQLSSR